MKKNPQAVTQQLPKVSIGIVRGNQKEDRKGKVIMQPVLLFHVLVSQ